MNNWRPTTIGKEILSGKGLLRTGPFGSQLHASDYVDNGIPCIMPMNMKDNRIDLTNISYISRKDANRLSNYLVKTGDIIYSRRGDVTAKALIRENESGYFCGTGCILVRPGNYIDSRFLLYYLSTESSRNWIKNNAVGITMLNLNTKILALFPILLPEYEEQHKIASVLACLDSKIELNNRINAELEAMAKTLYDYWFVQFDFPNAEGKPYKSCGGKMVWNNELKREIPEGWEIRKMSEWIDIDKSGDWGKEEAVGAFTKKVTCIRGADINGLNGLAELKPPTRYILEKNSFKILKSHDLIIEISGGSPIQSTGRIAFVTDATIKRFENPLICSNFCKPISIRNKKLLYNFVYHWNSLYVNGAFFGYEGKTSGIKNLLLDSFVNSHYTTIPDDKTVAKFYDIMENIQEKKQIALAENQQLSSFRDWLLPMLMTGQVKVAEE